MPLAAIKLHTSHHAALAQLSRAILTAATHTAPSAERRNAEEPVQRYIIIMPVGANKNENLCSNTCARDYRNTADHQPTCGTINTV